MIDIKSKRCEIEGCIISANYNYPGLTKGKYCATHKLEGMTTIKKKCKVGECNIRPCFNYPEDKRGMYCDKHKLKGMVNVLSKRCEYLNCDERRNYNYKGEKAGKFCRKHKLPDMIVVANTTCERIGCCVRPSFGYPGTTKRRFCKTHKESGMVNVCSKRCEYKDCDLIAGYSAPGTTIKIFCKKHAPKGYSYVSGRECKFCSKQGSFNLPGRDKGIYCKEHAPEGCVNVNLKRCIYKGCDTGVGYGSLFGDKIHCFKHKTANEFRHNKPKCEECSDKALYTNDDSNYPKRCEMHMINGDINIVEKECKNCKLTFFINESSGLCNDCNDFINNKVHKSKEKTVGEFLKVNNIQLETSDKIPNGSCSKYRPDFVVDMILFKLIIEVDENQHKSYACECEQARMIQLHQDFGGIPIVFLRYNPDSYKKFDENNNPVGKAIRGNKKRLHVLLKTINNFKNEASKEWSKPLSVCYLFYDGYNGIPELEEIKYL